MRLGLLADIHEEVERLDRAVARLRAEGVDRFLLLGDLYDTGKRLDELVEHLEPLDALGVWGNHDIGLCREVSDWTRGRFSPRVLNYFARLQPRIDLDGDLFQHIEPQLDPEDILDLWSFDEPWPPDPARCFARDHFRGAFLGHRHCWAAVTPDGLSSWTGDTPLEFGPDRRFVVVVHAVQQGRCALYDTEARRLCPFATD